MVMVVPNRTLAVASSFLLIATLLQIRSTSRDEAGPFDRLAGELIPRWLERGIWPGRDDDDSGAGAVAGDGGLRSPCPPDAWVDASFVPPSDESSEPLRSSEFDPRTKAFRPTPFPHCALRRWVASASSASEGGRSCPEGTVFATEVRPPKVPDGRRAEGREGGGRIPRVLHVSSPTNCLPVPVVAALESLVAHSPRAAFAAYVHSPPAMDDFLFRREWDAFPQVKEALLCGTKKVEGTTARALEDLRLKNRALGDAEVGQRVAEEVAAGVRRDVWRHLILWEYGGVAMDVEVLKALVGGSDSQHASLATVSAAAGGREVLRTLMRRWTSESESDAILSFVNNEGRQRLPYNERVPLTELMAAAPRHPLNFFAAKAAMKYAVWDAEKSITDTGRTTKIPPVRQGLSQIDRNWNRIKTGSVLEVAGKGDDKHSIRFVDADVLLPSPLTDPRTGPWRSVLAAFRESTTGAAMEEEDVVAAMRRRAAEQKYVGTDAPFSCMEYTLDLYLGKTTEKKK
ncbi:hypothetical protein ACHAWF_010170 [Thalassiosira exigua]